MATYNYSNGELQQIASTALSQIKATTANNVFNSWGVHKAVATVYNGAPALALLVDARLLKGFVFVVYNEGQDLYELYTADVTKSEDEVTKVIDGLYADDLGDWIDRTIERGENWQEYEAFCREEEKKLYQEIFS